MYFNIFNSAGLKTKNAAKNEFKHNVEKRVVSKTATGSVHIQAGHYTSEHEKEQRRAKIKSMGF
jgi:hypothetical protein